MIAVGLGLATSSCASDAASDRPLTTVPSSHAPLPTGGDPLPPTHIRLTASDRATLEDICQDSLGADPDKQCSVMMGHLDGSFWLVSDAEPGIAGRSFWAVTTDRSHDESAQCLRDPAGCGEAVTLSPEMTEWLLDNTRSQAGPAPAPTGSEQTFGSTTPEPSDSGLPPESPSTSSVSSAAPASAVP